VSRRRLNEHPVGGFVALAFAISYLVGTPILIAGLGFTPPGAMFWRTYGARVLVVYGPGIAALVMAGVTRRGRGPRALLRQMVRTGMTSQSRPD
jgi:hypothetical protein